MKDEQWLIPMVWPPDRATTSVGVRFLVARAERMVVALLDGAGRLSRVAFCVANVSPSFLPNGTS